MGPGSGGAGSVEELGERGGDLRGRRSAVTVVSLLAGWREAQGGSTFFSRVG